MGRRPLEGLEGLRSLPTSGRLLRYSTLRLMCALAAMLGRKLSTSDAVQAYLNAMLSEPRYGRMPKELREYNSDGVELIAFIRKALMASRRRATRGTPRSIST